MTSGIVFGKVFTSGCISNCEKNNNIQYKQLRFLTTSNPASDIKMATFLFQCIFYHIDVMLLSNIWEAFDWTYISLL